MIVKKKCKAYSSKQTLIHGQGFVDNFKGFGSYLYQNKDLIAKPMLGAVGDIAAFGMIEGANALIRKAMAEKRKPMEQLNPESRQIIERLRVGDGIKRF